MTEPFFPHISTWQFPTSVLPASLAELARDGLDGNEGIMLWAGRRHGGLAQVTHLLALRGAGVVKRPDHIHIESWLFNEVTDTLITLNSVLVGQIHSHGPGVGTHLSCTDRRYGITSPDYLSVVAPDFGGRPATQFQECGVYVFEPGAGYRRLPAAEVTDRIQVIDYPPIPVVIVGAVA